MLRYVLNSSSASRIATFFPFHGNNGDKKLLPNIYRISAHVTVTYSCVRGVTAERILE